MELALSEVPLSFEVTYDDPSLHVGMSIYDVSGMSPVLFLGPAAMSNLVGNTYQAKATLQNAKAYVVFKAVYTDGTFATLDPNYSQASESVFATTFGAAPSSLSAGCEVVGYVDNNNEIIGLVEC